MSDLRLLERLKQIREKPVRLCMDCEYSACDAGCKTANRIDIPDLLAEVDRCTKRVAQLEELLRGWGNRFTIPEHPIDWCPACGQMGECSSGCPLGGTKEYFAGEETE